MKRSAQRLAAIGLLCAIAAGVCWLQLIQTVPVETVRLTLFSLVDEEGEAVPWKVELLLPTSLRAGWPVPIAARLEPGLAEQQTSSIADIRAAGALVQLEARLELPGADSDPPGISIRRLEDGLAQLFRWNVTARRGSLLEGTLWIYVRYTPAGSAQPEIRQAVLARPLRLPVAAQPLSPANMRTLAIGFSGLALLAAAAASAAQWSRSRPLS